MQKKQSTTDWANVADWYDDLVGDQGSEFHREVVFPGILKLLKPQPKQAMLDVACGQGALCRILNDRGVEMTGVDAAAPLIAAARERGPSSIRYEVCDARSLDALPVAKFDAATCVLAIQNIHPISGVFDTVSRRLKDRGAFVVVMMHPAFRGAKETHWGWDDEKTVQYRRVDRYLIPRKSPIVAHPGKSVTYTWTFHKPIEAYVKAGRNAGLLVDAMEEWASHKMSTSGPRASAENTSRKEIPMFLAIRYVKIEGLAKVQTGDEVKD